MANGVRQKRPSKLQLRQQARERKRALITRRAAAMEVVYRALMARGLSQNKLAAMLGFSHTQGRKRLGNYIRGENRMPEALFKRMCELLMVDPQLIFVIEPAEVLLQREGERRGRKPQQQQEAA